MTIDQVLGVQLFDTIVGEKPVVVDQAVLQKDVVGGGCAVKVPTTKGRRAEKRVRAARVQTTRGLVGVDIVMIGIGERAAAATLTALMKVMPEKGRNKSVRIALNMKENMHVDVREDVEKGHTHDALAVGPRRRTQR